MNILKNYNYISYIMRLVLLCLLLPAACLVSGQVPGTPYGVSVPELDLESLPAGVGLLAGRACFDVAQSNNSSDCGDLTSRKKETLAPYDARADFTNTITSNQTYTFTTSGVISNVRFYYIEDALWKNQIVESIEGGNPKDNIADNTNISCNIVYKDNLNSLASGKSTAQALKVTIYVIYNDNATNTGIDRKFTLTVSIKDCACCGAFTTDGSWLTFMCYNLGADKTLATPEQQMAAPSSRVIGSYYPWGVRATGFGGNGAVDPVPSWWDGLVKDESHDPCPTGYRVPSASQFASIFTGELETAPLTSVTANLCVYRREMPNGLMVGDRLFLPGAGFFSVLGNFVPSAVRYNTRDWNNRSFIKLGVIDDSVAWYLDDNVWWNHATAFSIRCVLD